MYGIEDEFSALGGIRWDQIEAWMAIPRNITARVFESEIDDYRKEEAFMIQFAETKWIKNKDQDTTDSVSAAGSRS